MSRSRAVTTVHQSELDEVFNIQSPRRLALLLQLKRTLKVDKVPASFWACLQVCDLTQLERLIAIAAISPSLVSILIDTCYSLPRTWMQRSPWVKSVSSSTTSASSTSASATDVDNDARRGRARATKMKNDAQERDGKACVLTRVSQHQVAHIYPQGLISLPNIQTAFDRCIPGIWKFLHVFWDEDRVSRWRHSIFRDPDDSEKPYDGCYNMICLRDDVLSMWGKGIFALRPISLSPDRKQLHLQFYWQPNQTHGPNDFVEMTKAPLSSKDLTEVAGNMLSYHDSNQVWVSIKSGHIFTMTTCDPERLPLPSFELLEMQWYLTRIVSMSAAAEAQEDVDSDNGDGGNDLTLPLENSRFDDVLHWILPPPSDEASYI
jgi:HNH endonuclease